MIEQTRATDLEEFDQGWLAVMEQTPFVRLVLALGGLTRLGERPASLERLATILDRPMADTIALIRENTTARIEGDLIHWDDPYPGDRTRRTLYVGDREIPMRSGCAPDLFAFAAVLDVPFRVEDTCAATGAPIRIDFVPDGYERVDPPEAVTVLIPLGQVQGATGGNFAQINNTVCNYQPFFASAEAARGWLADHPGGRVFTVKEMFERSWLIYYRDNLRPLMSR
jgi:alkylmercury lyase-like protein